MKSSIVKSMMLIVALMFCTENSNAQLLKKIGSGLKKAATEVANAAVSGATESETTESETTETTTEESTVNADSLKSVLLSTMTFEVKKVIETDDNGKTLLNEDGTERVRYLLIDQDGKVCDATTAKKLVHQRLGQYGKILGNLGKGALTGGAATLLGGGSLKDVAVGAAAGAVAGIALSTEEMSNIKKLNKSIKNYKKTIEAYQKTFTDEGVPVDASIDLSNIDGVNFSKVETTTMPSSQIEKELAESKVSGESLDDIDFDKL